MQLTAVFDLAIRLRAGSEYPALELDAVKLDPISRLPLSNIF